MKPYAATLPFLLLPSLAFGQGAVVQSGVVVPNNFAAWSSNGVIKDSGLSSITIDFPAIANGHLIGNATGTTTPAQDTSLTALINTLGTAAQGDLLYRNGTVWTFLHAGTTGQFLQTLGAGANPLWATPASTTYVGSASISVTGSVIAIAAPVTVPNGGTGLTTLTSGGIPFNSGTVSMGSSSLLANHVPIVGGGAGAAPRSITNAGTAGQALVSNGPSVDPTFQDVAGGTVTQINTGGCLTGGPITGTGTIVATAATSGVCGVVTPDTNAAHFLSGAGTWLTPAGTTPAPLIGTSGTIGGSSLAAGGCSTGTIAIVGATTAMAVALNPVTYPGDAAYWKAYVSSAGTVTVANCIATAGTPAASVFAVRVIP